MSAIKIFKGKNEYIAVQLPGTADLSKTKAGRQILAEASKMQRSKGKFVKRSVFITERNTLEVGTGRTKTEAQPLNWLLLHVQTGKFSVTEEIDSRFLKSATA